MKKYIVTETESNTPNYKYQEEFDTIEEANLFLQENEDLVKDYYMMD